MHLSHSGIDILVDLIIIPVLLAKVHELMCKFGFAILKGAVSQSKDDRPLVYCNKRQAEKVSLISKTKREWIYDSVVTSNSTTIVSTHPTANFGGRQQMILVESLSYTVKYAHQLKAIVEGTLTLTLNTELVPEPC
jgi:hypothetical protein